MASNKKNKEINHSNLVTIKSITDNQKLVFDSWKEGKNQFLFGAAGTGETFISLYLALKDVNVILDKESGEPRMSHKIDKSTGMYNGRQILKNKSKKSD